MNLRQIRPKSGMGNPKKWEWRQMKMDVREKLVEILLQKPNKCTFEQLADFLIAHGVTVQDNTEISDEFLERLRKTPVSIMTEEPTIEVVQEWISVKDKQPKKEGSYLVYSSKSKTVFTAHYRPQFDRWANRANGQFITHWMPLPQPPKGE